MEYLYIIKEGIHKKYKIGRSHCVDSRMQQLQTANSNILVLVGQYECEDCVSLEKKTHSYLQNKRVIGEWFELDDNDLINTINFIRDSIKKKDYTMNKDICDMKFNCDICKYSTNINLKFIRHQKSKRHMRLQESVDLGVPQFDKHQCKNCQKIFTSRQHLYRHKNFNCAILKKSKNNIDKKELTEILKTLINTNNNLIECFKTVIVKTDEE